ncbi:MAG: hypothetical protein HZY79_14545 [Rhodoblastus sp.]|nr:MAG: hypothetical protein HZY79_14545 [Rhodoblastus sp.]
MTARVVLENLHPTASRCKSGSSSAAGARARRRADRRAGAAPVAEAPRGVATRLGALAAAFGAGLASFGAWQAWWGAVLALAIAFFAVERASNADADARGPL